MGFLWVNGVLRHTGIQALVHSLVFTFLVLMPIIDSWPTWHLTTFDWSQSYAGAYPRNTVKQEHTMDGTPEAPREVSPPTSIFLGMWEEAIEPWGNPHRQKEKTWNSTESNPSSGLNRRLVKLFEGNAPFYTTSWFSNCGTKYLSYLMDFLFWLISWIFISIYIFINCQRFDLMKHFTVY